MKINMHEIYKLFEHLPINFKDWLSNRKLVSKIEWSTMDIYAKSKLVVEYNETEIT